MHKKNEFDSFQVVDNAPELNRRVINLVTFSCGNFFYKKNPPKAFSGSYVIKTCHDQKGDQQTTSFEKPKTSATHTGHASNYSPKLASGLLIFIIWYRGRACLRHMCHNILVAAVCHSGPTPTHATWDDDQQPQCYQCQWSPVWSRQLNVVQYSPSLRQVLKITKFMPDILLLQTAHNRSFYMTVWQDNFGFTGIISDLSHSLAFLLKVGYVWRNNKGRGLVQKVVLSF